MNVEFTSKVLAYPSSKFISIYFNSVRGIHLDSKHNGKSNLVDLKERMGRKLPKKKMKLMESFTRLQWHKRQNSFQSNSSPSLSKNKLFERIPIFPDVLEHIRKYNLSSRKRTTSITRAQPEEINSPKVVSIVLQLFSCRFQFRFSASAISSFPVKPFRRLPFLVKVTLESQVY